MPVLASTVLLYELTLLPQPLVGYCLATCCVLKRTFGLLDGLIDLCAFVRADSSLLHGRPVLLCPACPVDLEARVT